jgi:NTE family protein
MIERAAPAGSFVSDGLAVVLGAGGVVGTAWMAGLAGGLRRGGVDLAGADLIVGTSAGAIVGALLAGDGDPDRLAVRPRPADPGVAPPRVDRDRMGEVFGVLGDPSLAPDEARRRVGRIALVADTGTEEAHVARMAAVIGATDWPPRKLLITAVDTETGQLRVFHHAGGAPLLSAVAASTAFPATAPPITVAGRRYMDGGLWSATNADLAVGARTLVVIEPLADRFPPEQREREIAAADAGIVVTITPDAVALEAFGPDLNDRASWQPSYQAGVRQSAHAAARIRAAARAARGAGGT